jgi:hypothetical protein
MKHESDDPSAVVLSISLYDTLLMAYPTGFRHEYGPHMAQVFRDCCLRSYRQAGLPGMLNLWALILIDYVKSVVGEHIQKGIHMSKSKFIRLSGWAFVLGAITFVTVELISLRSAPAYNPNNFLSKPIDLYLEYASLILVPTSLFLFLVGMVGFYLRYGEETNSLGKFGLFASMIGGVISFGAAILLVTTAPDWTWTAWMVGFMLYFLGLVLFGIAAVRDKLFPRWNALPILTGIWFPIVIIGSSQAESWTGSIQYINLGVFLLTAIGLAVLGYLLQSDSQPASPPTGAV